MADAQRPAADGAACVLGFNGSDMGWGLVRRLV